LKPTAKAAEVIWEPGTGLPPVYGDEAQLQQILLNMALNSLDAMDGKGSIWLQTWADGEGKKAYLAISDNGPGIPPEMRDVIFDPFFTTKEQGRGTGLGLAVTYGVIERHGGNLRLDENYLDGARFEIELPAYIRGEKGAKGEESPSTASSGATEDIIIGG
jgi:two-component system NtrC family sensor kinase